ncbi:ninjurin-1-like [Ctenocephalides felis]|uniref:ninjurin-1-like n=1 Tax=Ctenocephalides felis TaxID=7515 RepID=UPI000E6E1DCA|nr:ninjurin-1-like [Ctenocephalides felis]
MWGFRLKQNMAAAISPELTTMDRDERLKSLDANRYATKKTIAQGMLDIALLTANASQLKYILQVGEKHEFYTLMLTLISISIILQVLAAILNAILTIYGHHRPGDQADDVTRILNQTALGFIMGTLICDVCLQGIACVILGSALDINKLQQQDRANLGNNICLSLNIVTVILKCAWTNTSCKKDFSLDS